VCATTACACPTRRKALADPFWAFRSWFLRIECDRCHKVWMRGGRQDHRQTACIPRRNPNDADFPTIIIIRGFCGFHGWRLRHTYEIAALFVAVSGTPSKTAWGSRGSVIGSPLSQANIWSKYAGGDCVRHHTSLYFARSYWAAATAHAGDTPATLCLPRLRVERGGSTGAGAAD
jgi:hypothetical protein